MNIDSESIETLIAGGIAFASPEIDSDVQANSADGPAQLKSFTLYQDVDEDWLEWQPKVLISQ